LCRSTIGLPILRASRELVPLCLSLSILMEMSSQGTSVACNNSIVNNNREVYVSSTEKFYSSINSVDGVPKHFFWVKDSLALGNSPYIPQSEIFNPKQARYKKFAKNERARRQEKLKNMRKNGNQDNVPKSAPKKSPPPQPNVDFVHQSLVEKLYPASIVDLAKDKLLSMKAEAHTSRLMEVLEVVGALAITLPALETPAQVAAQIVL